MASVEKDSFSGFRYLMDASNSRQYAVRYEDGAPRPPFDVYAERPNEKGFRPNETVFAFADEATFTTKNGQQIVQVEAFQILIGETGNPRRLSVTPVEYALTIGAKEKRPVQAVLALTEESKAQLAAEGFADTFPARFAYDLDESQVTRKGNKATLEKSVLEKLSVPPNHDRYAILARLTKEHDIARAVVQKVAADNEPAPVAAPAAANAATAPTSGNFLMTDAQTLVEKKNLGDGDTLKIIFNFESRRVTESLTSAHGVALTSHKFKDYDETALESAFAQLQKLGGTPRPLEGVKKPATLKTPKATN
ncbi:MAG: hypothetical protein K0R10_21 [Alphaproteobacteria bacterium]|jgi:hypothetical protein|nr:hypothetical protein [Alphaproteobacteria bacterium]